jgi:hypothetical protein
MAFVYKISDIYFFQTFFLKKTFIFIKNILIFYLFIRVLIWLKEGELRALIKLTQEAQISTFIFLLRYVNFIIENLLIVFFYILAFQIPFKKN